MIASLLSNVGHSDWEVQHPQRVSGWEQGALAAPGAYAARLPFLRASLFDRYAKMVEGPKRGISAQGRSKTYKRRGLWAIKKKHGGKFPEHAKKEQAAAAAAKVQ